MLSFFIFISPQTWAGISCSSILRSVTLDSVELQPFKIKLNSTSINNKRPYSHVFNQHQRIFLEKLGASFEGDFIYFPSKAHAANTYNQMVDQLVQDHVIKQDEAVYWGEVLIQNQEMTVIKYGEQRPPNTVPFIADNFYLHEGKYLTDSEVNELVNSGHTASVRDFEKATYFFDGESFNIYVAQGVFPVAQSITETFEANSPYSNAVHDSAFLHDMGHLGGFIDSPAMMKFVRSWSSGDRQISLITEDLLLTNELSEGIAEDFLIPAGLHSRSESQPIRDYVDNLSHEDLDVLSLKIVETYASFRLPLGGVARTGMFSLMMSASRATDFEYQYIVQKRRILYQPSSPRFSGLKSLGRFIRGRGVNEQNQKEQNSFEIRSLRNHVRSFLLAYDQIAGLSFEEYLDRMQYTSAN